MKERSNGSKNTVLLLSPDKQFFGGYRLALKSMVDQNQPERLIAEMRQCLQIEGWLEDSTLPVNWLYKSKSENEGGRSIQFIDAKGVQKVPKNKSENFMPELENILPLCIYA